MKIFLVSVSVFLVLFALLQACQGHRATKNEGLERLVVDSLARARFVDWGCFDTVVSPTGPVWMLRSL